MTKKNTEDSEVEPTMTTVSGFNMQDAGVISSLGGSLYDGLALIDNMNSAKTTMATHATGKVMSMGAYIAFSGAKGHRTMDKNCSVMLHQYSTYSQGKYQEMASNRQHEDHLHKLTVAMLKKISTMSMKDIREKALGPHDLYLTPKQCLDYGLIDKII